VECGSTVSEAPAAAFSTDRRDMTELLLCVEMQVCLVGSFSYAPRRHHASSYGWSSKLTSGRDVPIQR
jgi:hypothetical protein